MTVFATIALPNDATKLRFKEPFVSEAMNLKDAGIVPPGIYRGFTASPQAGYLLNFNVSPVSNDSVAVVETTQHYNMTVRSNVQLTVDMTGQIVFPVYAVLRTEYGITPSPLAGFTFSNILIVNPALNNSNAQNLHTGDIKLCRILGFTGTTPNVSIAVPTDRQDNGGSLLTQSTDAIVTASKVDGSITPADTAGAWVDMPGPGAPTFDLVFTPGVTGKAEVIVSGTVQANPATLGIGLSVNGVDLIPAGTEAGAFGPVANGFVAGGGGRGGVTPSFWIGSISFTTFVNVTAGVPTTVRMRYIFADAPQSPPFTRAIYASPGHPLTMSVRYRA
jgi:hypothetical protein